MTDATADILKTLLFDSLEPNHLEEVAKLKQYIKSGCPCGDPLFLSLGETWEHTPQSLREYLGTVPLYAHGYQLSMYGLPELRQRAAEYVEQSHELTGVACRGEGYEVAISWTGTRNAMYDFGRLLIGEYFDSTPQIITTAPGWDYPGVFSPLGYDVHYVKLEKEEAFHPDIVAFSQAIDKRKDTRTLLAINAQHNPTSINWSEDSVRSLIRMALENSFALLIDDAHYGVCHPNVKPTSSLKILLEELSDYPEYDAPWMAFRSFGKQFGINGWGTGVVTSTPKTLDIFVNNYRAQHIYNYGGMQQHALAQWLLTDESVQYLGARSNEIVANKQLIKKVFIEKFGYPADDIFAGDCTNFVLFSVPENYAARKRGLKQFLDDCLAYGIVLTDAWPKPYDTILDDEYNFDCVRLFAGASEKVVRAFLERLETHKFHYSMRNFEKFKQVA